MLFITEVSKIGIFFLVSIFLASLILLASFSLSTNNPDAEKLSAYECGIEPTPQPVGGGRFPIKYYLTAMLFIVFDIEIVFLYPWAVTFDQLGFFGVIEMLTERCLVMQHGRVVEDALTDQLLEDPHHPYSQKLVAAART